MSRQPPPLEVIREFVIAGHGNLPKVQQMLAAQPALLNLNVEWAPGDRETALQAAAHVGSPAVAEYLLAQGAPLDICTAAMLGRQEAVAAFLKEDPAKVDASGAHRIPLLAHAALSGNVELVHMLVQQGARAGMSYALGNAVTKGHIGLTRWLLENEKPDLGWKNYQEKTALTIALESSSDEIAGLLREHGARA
jgi:ankyrin repeat protein